MCCVSACGHSVTAVLFILQVFEIPHIPDDSWEPEPPYMILTGLNPNTKYNVTLRAKALNGSGPWSDPTVVTFTTRSTGRYNVTLRAKVLNDCPIE